MREVCEVCEFFVNDENKPETNIIYRKNIDGTEILNSPSIHLLDYLESQGVDLKSENFKNIKIELPFEDSNNSNQVINNQSIQDDSELL